MKRINLDKKQLLLVITLLIIPGGSFIILALLLKKYKGDILAPLVGFINRFKK